MGPSGKKTVGDIDVAGKRVLVRVDYNVPFHPGTTEVSDDSRIRASLPTIGYLLERGCRVILCSHLGRPKGKVVEELRMRHVVPRLARLLDAPVTQASDCVGSETWKAVEALAPGGVLVLENLRFNPGEEANDPGFASSLASLADVYVDDAFGTAHRAHASTEGVTRFLPSVAGLLMARGAGDVGPGAGSPGAPLRRRPRRRPRYPTRPASWRTWPPGWTFLVVGGGMAATFLKARGLEVGDSLVEEDRVQFAAHFIERFRQTGLKLLLPLDVVVADSFTEAAGHRTVDVSGIEPGWRIMDIGPRTAALFEEALRSCKTVLWNGPMGVFEWKPFATGTIHIAGVLADLKGATTVVGGGSTAEAVASLGIGDKMTHVSTGGGAALELLEGRVLPGVAALMDRDGPLPPVSG